MSIISAISVGNNETIICRLVKYFEDIHPAGDWPDPADEEQFSNRQALVACSLVDHTWHCAAQSVLYHTIFASYQEQYCKAIATTLEEHRHLLVYVRELRLSSKWLARWWPIGWPAFSQMPRLVHLELQFDFWDEKDQYEELWRSLEHSEGLRNVKKLIIHGYPMPSLAVLRSHLFLFGHIQDLTLSSCTVYNESIGTSIGESLECHRLHPCLLSFQWMCESSAPTHEIDPLRILDWFDTSSLANLVLELTPTNWSSVLALCTQVKYTLRALSITYIDSGNGAREAIPNSTLPNLLLFANELPNTVVEFDLQMSSPDIIAWMQQTLIEVEAYNKVLDLKSVKLCMEGHTDPPMDLTPFVDALRALREYVPVDFTFSANDDTKERLFAISPMLPGLIEREIVTLTMTYYS